ncbi:MAG: UPF0271 protein [Cyclobacteriaceae bacterium]|jgi:UPF0271 protein
MGIDINCDLGEGIGNDGAIMPYISSCNIACGIHAGDSGTMSKTIALAKKHGVKIGAHPSYPDRVNFGRKVLGISSGELIKSIEDQVMSLKTLLTKSDSNLNHIKPHGALYNEAAINKKVAKSVISAVKSFGQEIQLFVPYKSVIAELAKSEGVQIKYEGFADRAYQDDLQLVSRTQAGAVLHEPEKIYRHVSKMINEQQVDTISGNLQQIIVDTICVHGDNPEAVEIVKFLFEKLKTEGIQVK